MCVPVLAFARTRIRYKLMRNCVNALYSMLSLHFRQENKQQRRLRDGQHFQKLTMRTHSIPIKKLSKRDLFQEMVKLVATRSATVVARRISRAGYVHALRRNCGRTFSTVIYGFPIF